ncbi:UDP-3-O-acyl-N-acetylglucosamine deacetylase [bacterium]|nr:UDP-3-O-acyl-N-acetylglucosamine deacetylase [bacterium]
MHGHQSTIERTVTTEGIGLHSGRVTRVELVPAETNEGIVFIRTDLPGNPRVLARPESVNAEMLARATELCGPDGATAGTVEHLLASCLAMGIDNLLVKMDGPELPIHDGSALPYAKLLEKAGRKKLDAARRPWRLNRTVTFVTDHAEVVAIPAESMTIAFFAELAHHGIPDQSAEFQVGPGDFVADLAPARTWVFYDDVAGLLDAGKIKGGSLDCAIVIRDGQPMNTHYRLDQELARHKLLDFLGDLAILGRPVNALLTARGSGHRVHHQFIETLRKELYS